jgi:hypothetical protein
LRKRERVRVCERERENGTRIIYNTYKRIMVFIFNTKIMIIVIGRYIHTTPYLHYLPIRYL